MHGAENGDVSRIHAYITLTERLSVSGPLATTWWSMALKPDSTDVRRCVVPTQAVFGPPNQ